jgi:hypothetical protein
MIGDHLIPIDRVACIREVGSARTAMLKCLPRLMAARRACQSRHWMVRSFIKDGQMDKFIHAEVAEADKADAAFRSIIRRMEKLIARYG